MTMRIRNLAMTATAALLGTTIVGCADRHSPFPPMASTQTKKDPKRMTFGELQQYASTSAALAVAETGTSLTQRPAAPPPIGRIERTVTAANQNGPESPQTPTAPTQPNLPATPTMNAQAPAPAKPAVTKEQFVNTEVARYREGFKIEGIRSGFYNNQQDAQRDALTVAAMQIEEKLRQLDQPIYMSRLLPYQVAKYIVPNSGKLVPLSQDEAETIKSSAVPTNNIRYQIDVELTDLQVRQLRGEDRVREVAPIVFGLVLLAGITSLFLRLTGMAASAVRRTVG
ncbi:MAG: hypothetical protein U0798_15640 [Gemmataceae bacterium]